MGFEIFHAIIGHKGMFMKVIKYPYDLFWFARHGRALMGESPEHA